MGSGGGGGSSQKTVTPPAPPDPTSEWYYENGVLKSQRVWDPSTKGYKSDVFMTPQEQQLSYGSSKLLGQALTGAQTAFDKWSNPDTQQQALNDYMDPQKRALTDSYNTSKGQFNTATSAGGMRGSVGAADYLAKKLESEKARGLADIQSAGQNYQFQLPSMALAPYVDIFNLANGAYTGQNQATAQNLEPSFQGSQAASNYQMGNYGNQLNYTNMLNANRKQSSGGGFISKLFGGF